MSVSDPGQTEPGPVGEVDSVGVVEFAGTDIVEFDAVVVAFAELIGAPEGRGNGSDIGRPRVTFAEFIGAPEGRGNGSSIGRPPVG